MASNVKVCNRCIMDTTAKNIVFDQDGNCNFCSKFIELSKNVNIRSHSKLYTPAQLNLFIENIKKEGRGKKYDCVIGLSGGVDSSWALVQAVKLGLRPLAVHMDNGWNSELAQNNISNIVQKLKVDLYTHVIDWIEYKKLMQAFFDADVIDVELLYDNAMLAVNYIQAAKWGTKYILAGSNHATEGMPMPQGWNWFKYDRKNIIDLGKRGQVKLNTFPAVGTLGYIWYRFFVGIKWTSFLDFFEYKKIEAIELLKNEYGFKPYPYKHYESIFTRFYQGYILPQKFNVDKRKLHLSTLIISNQMSRNEALEIIKQIPYPSQTELDADIQYFLKKMNWTKDMLQEYIKRPERSHMQYGSELRKWNICTKILLKLRGNKN